MAVNNFAQNYDVNATKKRESKKTEYREREWKIV